MKRPREKREGKVLRTAAVYLALITLLFACGCGYTTRFLIREDVKTVYVPIFDNSTYYRGFETALTSAVVDEINNFTDLRIASREDADSILTGRLVAVGENVERKGEDDAIILKDIAFTVHLRWRDTRSQADIRPPFTITDTARLYAHDDQDEMGRAFREAAQRIVQAMEENW